MKFALSTPLSALVLIFCAIAHAQALGKPDIDPNTRAVKPVGGMMLGGKASFDPIHQLVQKGGAKIESAEGGSFHAPSTPGRNLHPLWKPWVILRWG